MRFGSGRVLLASRDGEEVTNHWQNVPCKELRSSAQNEHLEEPLCGSPRCNTLPYDHLHVDCLANSGALLERLATSRHVNRRFRGGTYTPTLNRTEDSPRHEGIVEFPSGTLHTVFPLFSPQVNTSNFVDDSQSAIFAQANAAALGWKTHARTVPRYYWSYV